MKKQLLLLIFITISCIAYCQVDTLRIMNYNVMKFPTTDNTRADTLGIIVNYLKPDIAIFGEIETKAGADTILSRTFRKNGYPQFNMASYTFPSPCPACLFDLLYYDSNKYTEISTTEIYTVQRPITHYKLLIKKHIATTNDTINIFAMHLKAGSASSDSTTRAAMSYELRKYLRQHQYLTNIIATGDFNTYTRNEQAFRNFVDSGEVNNIFHDPINQLGKWHNNSAFKNCHTQSPFNTGYVGVAGGSTGGMDDRFDFLLVNNEIKDYTKGVGYISGTYRAVGNDGLHFNKAIIQTPVNTSVPSNILNALYHMSDHIPVFMKLKIDNPTTPLPVELISFTAKYNQNKTLIQWTTASEKDNKEFVIEKSKDLISFETLGIVAGAGNSNTILNYQLYDEAPYQITYYRIKQVDNNNDITYSYTISVNTIQTEILEIKKLIIGNNNLNMLVSKNNYEVKIIDMLGRIRASKVSVNNLTNIDISNLGKSVYFIVITSGGNKIVRKLVNL